MAKLTKAELRAKFHKRATYMGKIAYYTGAWRVHDDGDVLGGYFRWWHPLTWLLLIVMLPICAFVGEKLTEVIPLRLSKYWREHREELNWL